MFEQYQNNLETLSQTVKNDLTNSMKKLRRLRVKAVLKTTITTLILVGGVTATILVPNPISAAVIIGAATVLSGSEGVKHTLKRLKSVKKVKTLIKKKDKETDEQIFVNKVKDSVNDNPSASVVSPSVVSPSAPSLLQISQAYPNLRV